MEGEAQQGREGRSRMGGSELKRGTREGGQGRAAEWPSVGEEKSCGRSGGGRERE